MITPIRSPAGRHSVYVGDPIDRFEAFLVAEGHATREDLAAVSEVIAPALEEAAERARALPFPPPEEALKGVYSEPGYESPWWPTGTPAAAEAPWR